MEQPEALVRYLSPDRAARLAPMPFALLAVLVAFAARTKRLGEPFTLAYRRRSNEDPPAIQDRLPASRSDGVAVHHETIGDAARELVRAGLVTRRRKPTPEGREDGPGTPYVWTLAAPEPAHYPCWPRWGECLLALLNARTVSAGSVYLFARLGHLADARGHVVGTTPHLARLIGVDPKTLRTALHLDLARASGIQEVRPARRRAWSIQLGAPIAQAELAARRQHEREVLEERLAFPTMVGWPGSATTQGGGPGDTYAYPSRPRSTESPDGHFGGYDEHGNAIFYSDDEHDEIPF